MPLSPIGLGLAALGRPGYINLGRAAVFSSDAKSRWASDWVKWPGYDKFWTNVVRDLLPHATGAEARLGRVAEFSDRTQDAPPAEVSRSERKWIKLRFMQALANETRVSATAIQTVGGKGYDGFVLAVVNPS